MKTKEQIKKWLASQPWFPEYVDRLLCERTKENVIYYLNGEQEVFTISGAFGWGQEWDKWNERDEAFRLWLNSVAFEDIEEGQRFYYENEQYIKIGSITAAKINNITKFSKTCEVIAVH